MARQIHIRHILIILAALVFLYTLAGFFLVPWAGKKILISQLERSLGRPVGIESVVVHPYNLTAMIKGFYVKEKNQADFIGFQSLFVDLSFASLLKLSPEITRMELDSPVINLVLKKNNTFNFSDLKGDSKEKADEPSSAYEEIFGFKLTHARIINGQIHFSDQVRNLDHHIEKLNLNLPLLSSLDPDRLTRTLVDLEFLLNQTQINMHLSTLPFLQSLDTDLTLKTQPLNLVHYLGYLPLPKNLLVKQAEAVFDLGLTYALKKDNPSLVLKGSAGLGKIHIQDADQTPVLAIPQINISLSPSDLLKKKLGIKHLTIASPQLHLNRNDQGRLNLLAYLPQEDPSETKEPKGSKTNNNTPGFSFQLGLGEIKDARIEFTDAALSSPFKTVLSPVSLQVKDLKAGKEIKGEFILGLETEAAETLASQGQFSLAPLKAEGSLTLGKVSLSKYAPYYQDQINFDLQEGQAHLEMDFSVTEQENEVKTLIRSKEFSLTNVQLWDRVNQEIPIFIPELKIQGSVLDTGEKRLDLGQAMASHGKILLKRQADGSLNLVKNLRTASPGPVPSAEPDGSIEPETPADYDASAGSDLAAESESPTVLDQKPEGLAWKISLDGLDLEKFSLGFSDATLKDPVLLDLSDIRITAANLKTWGREKIEVEADLVWNSQGKIQVKGDILPPFHTGELDVSLDKIDIQSLEPYFTDQIKIKVNSGLVHTQGRLFFSLEEKPKFSFRGKASVTDFVSKDKETNNDFFKCQSLYLSEMDLSLFPLELAIKEISLTDFYSRIILSDKGEINLKQVFSPAESTEVEPPSAGTDKKPISEIHIDQVTLQGGHIDFTDYLTQPNFTAQMKEIAGGITQLSSTSAEPAKIQLQGVHGQSSPLDIVGRIQPLALEKFFEVDISFKNVELVKFSPYSAKYIGYKIEKGKLILDLKYRIEGNKLESKNRLVFDQLTLGEKVESKDATSLPVGLAITLLKDSKGQINLDLPVTGNLNDPKFSFSSSVFAVLGNMITKVVTAPFAVLGSLFGGGEELGFVKFDYGSKTLRNPGKEKLDQLITILSQKEQLKLEIEGTYHRVRDGEVLRKNQYEELLRSEKILAAKGVSGSSPEEVKVRPEEREIFILSAYEQASFPKPREADGREKTIPLEEKEKLLLTNILVTDLDLENLAMARAETIRNYILSTAKVAAQRLFLRDPDSIESDSEENQFAKVKFSLR